MAKQKQNEESAEVGASSAPSSPAEMLASYLKDNPEYPYETAFIADDGTIFPGTVRGMNAADNYKAASGVGYVEVSKS